MKRENTFLYKFNAHKTKTIITSSKIKVKYYQDTHPWKLNNKTITVADTNEHLCLIISGIDEEQFNVDESKKKCCKSMLHSPLLSAGSWMGQGLLLSATHCLLSLKPF